MYLSLDLPALGKVTRQSPKATPASNVAAQTRLNRRNNSKQAQIKKRQELISATRIFNGVDGAPRIVAVVPLTDDVSAQNVAVTLAQSVDPSAEGPSNGGVWKLRCVHPVEYILSSESSRHRTLGRTASRRHCNSSHYPTNSSTLLSMRARLQTTLSSSSLPMLKSMHGATPSFVHFKHRACLRLSPSSPLPRVRWSRRRNRAS